MKHIVFIAALFFATASFAQVNFPIDEKGRINFTEVVTADSMSADQLYSKARLFIAHAYNSSKDVTQLTDDETKTILIKAITKRSVIKLLGIAKEYGYVAYTLVIQCKDGRYKYEIKDLVHKHHMAEGVDGGLLEQELGKGFSKKAWQSVKEQSYAELRLIEVSLKKFMIEKRNDNW